MDANGKKVAVRVRDSKENFRGVFFFSFFRVRIDIDQVVIGAAGKEIGNRTRCKLARLFHRVRET